MSTFTYVPERTGRVTVLDAGVLRHLAEHPARGKRYTTRELAEHVGASHSTIGHLLTGARTTLDAALAARIAEAIGVPPQVIFAPWLSAHSDDAPKEGM